MKRLVLFQCVWAFSALAFGIIVYAQQPFASHNHNTSNVFSLAELTPTPTPEMWFYVQERQRYDEPKEVVRRNAEFKAAQRRLRIEARKWYGYSPSRPTVNSTPTTGVYAPTFVRNAADPFRWVGGGVLRVVTDAGSEMVR